MKVSKHQGIIVNGKQKINSEKNQSQEKPKHCPKAKLRSHCKHRKYNGT